MVGEKELRRLEEGNARFVSGNLRKRDVIAERKKVKDGQRPQIIVIGCSDSRVVLRDIFDTSLGDIFTLEKAGNLAEKGDVGSIVYALEQFDTPLILILGHTKCGAVTATCKCGGEAKGLESNLAEIVRRIAPAYKKAKNENPGASAEELVDPATKNNLREVEEYLKKQSNVIAERVETGRLKIAGGIYDLESGRVTLI